MLKQSALIKGDSLDQFWHFGREMLPVLLIIDCSFFFNLETFLCRLNEYRVNLTRLHSNCRFEFLLKKAAA